MSDKQTFLEWMRTYVFDENDNFIDTMAHKTIQDIRIEYEYYLKN